jgi:hypothetical protein
LISVPFFFLRHTAEGKDSLVIMVRQGAIAASNMPRKILATRRPVKLLQAAVQPVATPQSATLMAKYFAAGTF